MADPKNEDDLESHLDPHKKTLFGRVFHTHTRGWRNHITNLLLSDVAGWVGGYATAELVPVANTLYLSALSTLGDMIPHNIGYCVSALAVEHRRYIDTTKGWLHAKIRPEYWTDAVLKFGVGHAVVDLFSMYIVRFLAQEALLDAGFQRGTSALFASGIGWTAHIGIMAAYGYYSGLVERDTHHHTTTS